MTGYSAVAFVLLVLTSLSSAPSVADAAESYDNCTGFITSLPTVISTPGTWCLKQNLSTALIGGNAITIVTNNVTLDCNDFQIKGTAIRSDTQAFGIQAVNRLNATVRNCNVRGFYIGLYFADLAGASGGGHLVEHNLFGGNTFIGLWVDGDGSVVRRNRVLDTGGNLYDYSDVYGIYSTHSVDILDNTVSNVTVGRAGNGWALGIFSASNAGGSIARNGVRDLFKSGSGRAIAIRIIDSNRMALRGNDLVGDASAGSVGVSCDTSTGAAKDNTINSFATALSSCSDSGGNAIVP